MHRPAQDQLFESGVTVDPTPARRKRAKAGAVPELPDTGGADSQTQDHGHDQGPARHRRVARLSRRQVGPLDDRIKLWRAKQRRGNVWAGVMVAELQKIRTLLVGAPLRAYNINTVLFPET